MTFPHPSGGIAVDFAMRYEASQQRTAIDIGRNGVSSSPSLDAEIRAWLGPDRAPSIISCDLVSRHATGELARLIEVKGRNRTFTSVSVADRRLESANAIGADWWLYVVFDCGTDNPFLVVVDEPRRLPWHLLGDDDADPRTSQGNHRGVKYERKWHVMPANIIDAGTRIDLTCPISPLTTNHEPTSGDTEIP